MVVPYLDIINGVTDLSGQLLELYKIRRDGTFFEQQSFLSKLHEYEADTANERAVKREILLAKLGERQARADHLREMDSQLTNARITVAVQRELQADARFMENAPYAYDPVQLRSITRQATHDGSKPAMLIAPFFNDELSAEEADNGPPTFRIAIRRSWLRTPWSNDVALLDGLLKRPLRNTDVDVFTIRQTLHDLPVILIHGEIQSQNRVWCSITAWNVAPQSNAAAIVINLPPLPLPQVTTQERKERLEFEDGLGWAVAVTAGLLAEWFHVARTGRPPRLDKLLAEASVPLREIGPSLAAAYEVAIYSGVINPVSGHANQALLLADSGYDEAALELLRGIATDIDVGRRIVSPDARKLLQNLVQLAKALHDSDVADTLQRSLELESARYLMTFLSLPEDA